jgi:DNA-directed RNA polymerase subunit K/omega
LAAHRARAIAKGSAATLDPDNDKNSVLALREIAEKTLPANDMREGLISRSMSRRPLRRQYFHLTSGQRSVAMTLRSTRRSIR